MAALSASTCESDFVVLGLQPGEQYVAPVRIASTFIALTVTSAWFNWRTVNRLNLFFAHWLSGVVMSLGFAIDNMMVTVCWANSKAEGFLRTMKFVEMTSSNMLAITNLAICVNLALIVSSHRTQSRVKSVSSPRLVMMFLVISMAVAAVAIPFWDTIIVIGTGFWFTSVDEERRNFLNVLIFIVQFIVGVCMFIILVWLLAFRMKEVKACWRRHRHIRHYFSLTVIGTFVNLGLGICGTINIVIANPETNLLLAWSWLFRFIHIALDTIVLYGVLRERSVGVEERFGPAGASSGQRFPGRGIRRGSWKKVSKPVVDLPLII